MRFFFLQLFLSTTFSLYHASMFSVSSFLPLLRSRTFQCYVCLSLGFLSLDCLFSGLLYSQLSEANCKSRFWTSNFLVMLCFFGRRGSTFASVMSFYFSIVVIFNLNSSFLFFFFFFLFKFDYEFRVSN